MKISSDKMSDSPFICTNTCFLYWYHCGESSGETSVIPFPKPYTTIYVETEEPALSSFRSSAWTQGNGIQAKSKGLLNEIRPSLSHYDIQLGSLSLSPYSMYYILYISYTYIVYLHVCMGEGSLGNQTFKRLLNT